MRAARRAGEVANECGSNKGDRASKRSSSQRLTRSIHKKNNYVKLLTFDFVVVVDDPSI